MLIQKPSSVSSLVPFSPAAIDCLWHNSQLQGCTSISGVSLDGTFGWVAKGGNLEVFDVQTGQRLAAWHFGGTVNSELPTVITAVCEFGHENVSCHLLVATSSDELGLFSGCLCLFDVHKSAVIRAIRLPYNITALETISAAGPDQELTATLSDQLLCFCGIVAAGTKCGHVYLIDLCLDDVHTSTEQIARDVEFITTTEKDVLTIRYEALQDGTHLCVELGENAHERGMFCFRKPDGSVSEELLSKDVSVTSLHFVKPAGLLAVGFNFGCFQLWKLGILLLEFSSRFDEGLPSVTNFAYQEPEDDPKFFGYLWVVRGPTHFEPISKCTSYITLYQLGFSSKPWCDGFGFLLEDLHGIWIRFEHDLHSDPFEPVDEVGLGSRVISCYTLSDWRYKPPPKLPDNDQSVDESFSPNRNRCLFVWEALSQNTSRCFMAIFDMNFWYNAQIPSNIRATSGPYDTCPYWSVYCLDEVMQYMSPERLLTVYVGYETLCHFMPSFCPSPDQLMKFALPVSMSFKLHGISESGVVDARFLGLQRQVLADLSSLGVDALLEPNDVFLECTSVGLITVQTYRSLADKREALLSLALNHHLVTYVTSCIEQLSVAEFASAGCTMRFMLEWAWKCVTKTKENIDKLCEPLFDWSGQALVGNDLQMMRHYQLVCRHLVRIFESFTAPSASTTESGNLELVTRLTVVKLISEYVNAIMWFHAVALLPEHSDEDDLEANEYAFPTTKLTTMYQQLRNRVTSLHSGMKATDLLIIDQLFESDATSALQMFKEKSSNRLYPPTNFHVLLNMYLLADVTSNTKHMITLYLLNDLVDVNEDRESRHQMTLKYEQYCRTFGISNSVAKLVRGFWLLDHELFKDASTILFDTSIHSELSNWQYKAVLRAFLCQGFEQLALTFMTLTNVPTLTPEDIKLKLTVLLANGLTNEAIEYQRRCHDYASCEELMSHMILASLQTNTIGHLLHLSLTPEENIQLIKYFNDMKDLQGHNLLVLHHLQRSNVVDAVKLDSLTQSAVSTKDDVAKTRHVIIDGYRRVLPAVQRKFTLRPNEMRSHVTARQEYERPLPLSATLFSSKRAAVVTRATLLNTVLDKVSELKPESMQSTSQRELQARKRLNQSDVLFSSPAIPPSSSRRRSRAVTSDVIFPVPSRPSADEMHGMTPLHKVLQARLSTAHVNTSSSAALSVLQTPPVNRKMSKKQSAGKSEARVTKSALHTRQKESVASQSKTSGVTWNDVTVHLISPLSQSWIDTPPPSTNLATVNTASPVSEEPRGALLFNDMDHSEEEEEEGVAVPQDVPSKTSSLFTKSLDDVMEVDDEIVFRVPSQSASDGRLVLQDDMASAENESLSLFEETHREDSQVSVTHVETASTEKESFSLFEETHYEDIQVSVTRVETQQLSEDVSADNSPLNRPPLWQSNTAGGLVIMDSERGSSDLTLIHQHVSTSYTSHSSHSLHMQMTNVCELETDVEIGQPVTDPISCTRESHEVDDKLTDIPCRNTESGGETDVAEEQAQPLRQALLSTDVAISTSISTAVEIPSKPAEGNLPEFTTLSDTENVVNTEEVMDLDYATVVEPLVTDPEESAMHREVISESLEPNPPALLPTDEEAVMELDSCETAETVISEIIPSATELVSEVCSAIAAENIQTENVPSDGAVSVQPEMSGVTETVRVDVETIPSLFEFVAHGTESGSETVALATEMEFAGEMAVTDTVKEAQVADAVPPRVSPRHDPTVAAGDIRPRRQSVSRADVTAPVTPTRRSTRLRLKSESELAADNTSVVVAADVAPSTPNRRSSRRATILETESVAAIESEHKDMTSTVSSDVVLPSTPNRRSARRATKSENELVAITTSDVADTPTRRSTRLQSLSEFDAQGTDEPHQKPEAVTAPVHRKVIEEVPLTSRRMVTRQIASELHDKNDEGGHGSASPARKLRSETAHEVEAQTAKTPTKDSRRSLHTDSKDQHPDKVVERTPPRRSTSRKEQVSPGHQDVTESEAVLETRTRRHSISRKELAEQRDTELVNAPLQPEVGTRTRRQSISRKDQVVPLEPHKELAEQRDTESVNASVQPEVGTRSRRHSISRKDQVGPLEPRKELAEQQDTESANAPVQTEVGTRTRRHSVSRKDQVGTLEEDTKKQHEKTPPRSLAQSKPDHAEQENMHLATARHSPHLMNLATDALVESASTASPSRTGRKGKAQSSSKTAADQTTASHAETQATDEVESVNKAELLHVRRILMQDEPDDMDTHPPTAVLDDFHPEFLFSGPLPACVDRCQSTEFDVHNAAASAATTTDVAVVEQPNFIFSPPVTRLRSAKKSSFHQVVDLPVSEPSDDGTKPSTSGSVPAAVSVSDHTKLRSIKDNSDQPLVKKTKTAPGAKKLKRTKNEPEDTVVLLSPFTPEEPSPALPRRTTRQLKASAKILAQRKSTAKSHVLKW